jgi:acyl-CoA thioesterase FadM
MTEFEHEIRVFWSDCDPAKIAYTARIPAFALEAIDAWWERHTGGGWYQMELDRNIGTPFVNISMNMRSPVTPRHRLICKVWPTMLGETSIGFHVDGLQGGELCFEGDFVCVFVAVDQFKKVRPPEEFREIVQAKLRPAKPRPASMAIGPVAD